MYQALFILLLLTFLISIVQIMYNRRWTLIYTAFGHEKYFAVAARLKHAGVKYQTKSPFNSRIDGRFKDNTQYDIYVKKGQEHLAQSAIHGNYYT